jgi:hypothetical protein
MRLMFILAVVAGTLVSCVSPYPNLRLTPTGESSFWDSGKEYSKKKIDNVTVQLSFDRNNGDTLIFNVNVINESEKEFLFVPSGIYYVQYAAVSDLPDEMMLAQSSPKIYAYDPEAMISATHKQIDEENARFANQQTADAVFGCLGAATSAASIATNDKETLRKNEEDMEEMDRNSREDEINHRATIREYQSRAKTLETTSARKTTLLPHKSLSGKVYIPVKLKNGFVVVNVPIENKSYIFGYNQEIVNRSPR